MNKTDWTLARRGSKFSWKRGLYTVVSISDGGQWILERVRKRPYYSAKNLGNGSAMVLHEVERGVRKKVWPTCNIEVQVFVDGDFRWIIYGGKSERLFISPSYKIDDLKKGESLLLKGEDVKREGSQQWYHCEQECLGIGNAKVRYKDPHYETLAVALLIYDSCYHDSI